MKKGILLVLVLLLCLAAGLGFAAGSEVTIPKSIVCPPTVEEAGSAGYELFQNRGFHGDTDEFQIIVYYQESDKQKIYIAFGPWRNPLNISHGDFSATSYNVHYQNGVTSVCEPYEYNVSYASSDENLQLDITYNMSGSITDVLMRNIRENTYYMKNKNGSFVDMTRVDEPFIDISWTNPLTFHYGSSLVFWDGSTEFEETEVDISKCQISPIPDKKYSGKKIKPSVTVRYNGKTLAEGTDYQLSYKNNKDVGKATVTVKGLGIYVGSTKTTFKIVPKPVKLSSLKAGKKELTVKWKKGSGVSGYEIQYSLNEDFSDAKTLKVKDPEKTETTVSKLKGNKKYYVRIRTFQQAGKKTYYSDWSSAKSKKTSKK